MSTTTSIVFRYDKVNGQGIGPIYVRLIKNRKASYISTGKKVHKDHWDKSTSKVKRVHPNCTHLNNYLNKLLLEYDEKLLKEEGKNLKAPLKAIKNKLLGKESADFFVIGKILLNQYYSSGQIGTCAKSASIMKKMGNYIKRDQLSLLEINPTFLSHYESYLRVKHLNKVNTIHKDMKFIRRVFSEAYRLGLIEHNDIPFNRYKMKTERTHKVYLTLKEVELIDTLDVQGNFTVTKDMFVFSAYSGGIRVSDALKLQCKNFDGTHIHFNIQKTKGQLSIKLPNRALLIISEYVKGKNSNEFIFPMLPIGLDLNNPVLLDAAVSRCTALLNKNLKALAKKAEINKRVSTHTARHTWATIALQKGISLDKVSKLMGHASVKETQVYAKIVSEELDKAMESFN